MIVALYKVWRGHEFIVPSIESIYHNVGRIVVVSSEIGWNGQSGNTVTPLIDKWAKTNDPENKIRIIECDSANQDEQYKAGLHQIRETMPECEWILLIDADEVWDDEAWAKANWFLRHSDVDCLRCRMHSYIKDVHYRIIEHEACCPTAFVRPWAKWSGVRANRVEPSILMDEVYVHHFTAVRDDVQEILAKFETSSIGDGDVPMVDMRRWRHQVWDKIPNVSDFHYNRGSQHVWKGVEEVGDDQLPRSVL